MALEKGIFLNDSGNLEINSGNFSIDPSGSLGITGSLLVNAREIVAGITAGGSAGQVLAKKTADDYDVEWITPSGGGGGSLPTGGITGDALVKNSLTDGDATWSTRVPYTLTEESYTFTPATVTGTFVYRILERSNGGFIIGGSFSQVNGQAKANIVALTKQGELDTSFNVGTGANGTVYSLGELSDGSIIVAGEFTSYNGTACDNLIKLNTNGTINSTFSSNLALSGGIPTNNRAMKILSNNKILISYAGTYNGRAYLCRINADGTLDTTFANAGLANQVYALEVDGSGFVYAGMIGGAGLAKISPNGGSPVATYANSGNIRDIALSPDGKIFIVGRPITYGGTDGLIKINSDLSTVDTAFMSNYLGVGGSSPEVDNVFFQKNGKILISGKFDTYGGNTQGGIVRLNSDGTVDTTINFGTGFQAGVEIYDAIQLDDGIVVCGGTQTSYDGTALTSKVTFLKPDGTVVPAGGYNIEGIRRYDIKGAPYLTDTLFQSKKKADTFIDQTFFGGQSYSFVGVTGTLQVEGALKFGNNLIEAGVPSGGSLGQAIVKNSSSDYDYSWASINTPAGSNRMVQFNNSGQYGGATGFEYVAGTGSLQQGLTVVASGTWSHAQGQTTLASAIYSHAEGQSTTSGGTGSHSEGLSTTSGGTASHAEGQSTVTIAQYSHAEGQATTTTGTHSHAEGSSTIALGTHSHAEGQSNRSFGNFSHAEGQTTTSIGTHSHAEGSGTTSIGTHSHAEGQSTRSIGNYSHSEGQTSTSIGVNSHSEGLSTTAVGTHSHSEGNFTRALANYAHSEGDNNNASGIGSHAEGTGVTAGSNYSHAEGYRTITANFDYNHAEGVRTTNWGYGSHTEGVDTLADSVNGVGQYAHAEGQATTVLGAASHSEGTSTTAWSAVSHAEGMSTLSGGYGSHTEGQETTTWFEAEGAHAEGYLTTAVGRVSHAEGYLTIAGTGASASHAEGYKTTTLGWFSHAEGYETTTSASATGSSHAEGYRTISIGNFSHSEGHQSRAIGQASHSEGQTSTAIGNYSHAEGLLTTAKGQWSLTLGYKTISGADYQTVTGFANSESTTAINTVGYKPFIVGIGNGDGSGGRANVFEVYQTGAWSGGNTGRGTIVLPNYNTFNYTSDANAAAGNIPLGGVYHNSGALRIRIA